jgi:hypothetical protein
MDLNQHYKICNFIHLPIMLFSRLFFYLKNILFIKKYKKEEVGFEPTIFNYKIF